MDIVLNSNNIMKVFNKAFMHLHPVVNNQRVVQDGKYNATCKEYGTLGQIVCIHVWEVHTHELKELTLLMSEGTDNLAQYVDKKGLKQLDKIQVCTFRFLRRSPDELNKLMTTEVTRAGLPFFTQQSMFQS